MALRYILCRTAIILLISVQENTISSGSNLIFDNEEYKFQDWEFQRHYLKAHLCTNNISECVFTEILFQKLINETFKYEIVHQILNGTNSKLYGSNSEEKVDPYFADSFVNKFITRELFGPEHNILTFLVEVLYDNVTVVRDFNAKIRNKLEAIKTVDDNRTLTSNAIDWIINNCIQPLLPNVIGSMEIFSPDYAYAQAGEIFARMYKLDLTSITTKEFIQLSHAVELSVKLNHMNESYLQIFMLPALFHYCHRHVLAKELIISDLMNGTFNWTLAYHNFVSENNEINNSPILRFFSAMSTYRNRTEMAKYIIQKNCTNRGLYGSTINYKNSGNSYYCIKMPNSALAKYIFNSVLYSMFFGIILENIARLNTINASKLRDVTELFKEQNRYIADRFREFETFIILNGIQKDTQFRRDIENRTLYRSEIFTKPKVILPNSRGVQGPLLTKNLLSESVDLFGYNEFNSSSNEICSKFYAILRDRSRIEFSAYNENYPRLFYMDVIDHDVVGVNKKEIVMQCVRDQILKRSNENVRQLAVNIASVRAVELRKYLTESGMDLTGEEKIENFFLSLIPFYNGIKSILDGDISEGVFLIIIDSLSFIPIIADSIKVSYELFMAFAKSSLKSIWAKESILSAMRVGWLEFHNVAEEQLFSRQAFINFGKNILRAVDPGFELLYSAGKSSLLIFNYLKYEFRVFSEIINAAQKHFQLYKMPGVKMISLPHSKITRYVSKIDTMAGKSVYIKIHPLMRYSASPVGYGYKYLEFPGNRYGELRNVVNQKNVIPVEQMPGVYVDGQKVFSELDIETGEPSGLRLIENKHGDLEYTTMESKCMKIRQ